MSQLTLTGAGASAASDGILFHDTFTDTDGVSLDAHVPDIGLVSWVEQNGDWDINTNRARPGVTNSNIATVNLSVADLDIEATIVVAAAARHGCILRYTNINNYWHVGLDAAGTAFVIQEINAGVGTVRATAAVSVAAGTHTLWVRVEGSRIDAVWDGTVWIYYSSATHNQAVTVHGMNSRLNTLAQFDSFTAYTAGKTTPPISVIT